MGKKYNERLRIEVSNKIVTYSKEKQDLITKRDMAEIKLKNSKHLLSYEDYTILAKQKYQMQKRIDVIDIRIETLEMVREMCFDVSDSISDEK